MAFPEAQERLFKMKICLKCNAHNPMKATLCRKCGYDGLRSKHKEKKA